MHWKLLLWCGGVALGLVCACKHLLSLQSAVRAYTAHAQAQLIAQLSVINGPNQLPIYMKHGHSIYCLFIYALVRPFVCLSICLSMFGLDLHVLSLIGLSL